MMTNENNGIERLSKRLSLMAMVDPDLLEKMADMLQYDKIDLLADIFALEEQTQWQENPEEAEKWHLKGRECFNAGKDKEAFLCFCKGAENGSAEDLFITGCCFAEGRGIRQNDEAALRCYQKSAEKDFPDAMYYLGLCYEQGIGTEKDFDQAAIWLKKAADLGYRPPVIHLEEQPKKNNQEELSAEAERLPEDQNDEIKETHRYTDPMEKKASRILEAMGVHLSDEDISKLNESVKEKKSFPEMVRDFSSMIYKDNPQMQGAFDAVSDETIASWKNMLDDLLKGGSK